MKTSIVRIEWLAFVVAAMSSVPSHSWAVTINASSCSQSAVQSAVNSASNGDTVMVPAGTCSWSGGLSISGIKLIGAGKSTSGTVITTGAVTITKHPTQHTRLSGFRFTGTGRQVTVDGIPSNKPYIIDNNYFSMHGGTGSSQMLGITVNGGLLHHNDFTSSSPTNADIFNIVTGEDWSQAPTYGNTDTTGERNIYFEDNTFTNILETSPDGDQGGRYVFRYNTYVDSSIVFHSSAPVDSGNNSGGTRQFEIYNNTFDRVSNSAGLNKWIWARGGSGIIANNSMERADSPDGFSYGNKAEIRLSLACTGNPPYPMQYQIGQSNQTPQNPPSRPLLIFGNTGAGTTDSNFISVESSNTAGGSCSNPGNYIQLNRDYYRSNQWNWTPYTYPHPLASGGTTPPPPPPPGDTTPPTVSITAPTAGATVSGTAVSVTATASDNVGVTSVAFRVDSTTLFTDTASPYSMSWNTTSASEGSHALTAVASDAAGKTTTSSTVTVTVDNVPASETTPPSTPGTPSASSITSSSLSLSWTASTDNVGVTGYRVERCTGSSCTNFVQVGTPTGTTYNDTGLTANTAYRYRVRAADAAGNLSGYSSIASATTASGGSGPLPLPEGNNGIAAAYPGDTNIQSNANVFFADGFESYSSANQLTTNWNSYYQGGNTRIATEAGNVFAGSRSVEFTLPQVGSDVSNALVKNVSPTQDTLFVRVYTKFESGFDVVSPGHNGIRISSKYPGPGQAPNGTDFFLFLLENSTFYNETEPGYTHIYTYHPEQRSEWGDHWYPDGKVLPFDATPGNFGSTFVPRPNFIPVRNQWYSYELMVKANTPGQRDGRVAAWIDGNLIADFHNVRVRDVSNLKIDQIQLELHSQSSSARPNKKWYDNVVVARSYVGPMSSGTPPPLQAPGNLHVVP